jgi:hypothetical protein
VLNEENQAVFPIYNLLFLYVGRLVTIEDEDYSYIKNLLVFLALLKIESIPIKYRFIAGRIVAYRDLLCILQKLGLKSIPENIIGLISRPKWPELIEEDS